MQISLMMMSGTLRDCSSNKMKQSQRYLSQVESEMFDSWQYDSTKEVLHSMNLTFFVTMAMILQYM